MTPLRRHLHQTTAIVRDPISIGTAIAGAIGVTGTIGTWAVIGATYVGISVATSWVLNALAPKPSFGSSGTQGILVNQKSPVSPHDIVYGRVRKGGTISYYETTGDNNRFLHQIIVLAGHEVEQIGDIYINDEAVTLDGSGFVTGDKWQSKIRIKKYDGTQTAADPDLLAESNQIGSSFIGFGIAYLYVRYAFDQDVFANGIPLITAVVKGKKVYDPRTDTTAWSDNAALCVRDYLTADYGLKVSRINDTSISVAANICDEAVALDAGGTQTRYTINGVLNTVTNHGDALLRMMTACAGTLFYGAGYELVVGAYTSPIETFTLDDLRSEIDILTRTDLRDQFNAVQGIFVDEDQRWISTDYPIVRSQAFIDQDGGEETVLDFEQPMTSNTVRAQRIAKATLFRAREQITFTAAFSIKALGVSVGSVVSLDIARYGWSNKTFEVRAKKMVLNPDTKTVQVVMTLREISSTVFDWDAEESATVTNNTNLLSPFEVPSVGVTVTSRLQVFREKLTNVAEISVTSAASERIDFVEVQFKNSADLTWVSVGTGEVGRFEVVDLLDGSYDFRARAINSFGVKGEWATASALQIAGLSEPPGNVVNFNGTVNGANLHLTWNPVADLDLSYYRIRYTPNLVSASWANSVNYSDRVPRPATEVSVPARSGTYLIKAIDKSGSESVDATSFVVRDEDLEQFATTLTQVEDPLFDGAKTDCVVVDGALRIADVTNLNDLSGNWNDLTGDFNDLGIASVGTAANYLFSDVIDTGAVRRCRVRVDSVTSRFNDGDDLWDDLSGNIDALSGLWDDLTGVGNFADVNVRSFVSVTDDDPSGSPTWSNYIPVRVADLSGRAFRFRIDLESDTSGITPVVEELSAVVQHN